VQHCEAIDQIMLYNNQSPITSALIVPAKDKLTKMGFNLATEQGRRDALQEIDKEIRQFLKGGTFYGQFPERWLPGTFAVLNEPFSEQNHMINSTMKLVRPKVEQIYKERLEYVYTSEGRKIDNPLNINALG
jgi:long-chain acyl-CoA synthetase